MMKQATHERREPRYLRNIIWPELNQVNAEHIRKALEIEPVERGPNAWRAKVIEKSVTDWANELAINPNALDRKTVLAYEQLYANEVYVKKPWNEDKKPVYNASFTEAMETNIAAIGHELERLGMANATAKTGFNRTAVVMLALDKYAKKLELLAGMDAVDTAGSA